MRNRKGFRLAVAQRREILATVVERRHAPRKLVAAPALRHSVKAAKPIAELHRRRSPAPAHLGRADRRDAQPGKRSARLVKAPLPLVERMVVGERQHQPARRDAGGLDRGGEEAAGHRVTRARRGREAKPRTVDNGAFAIANDEVRRRQHRFSPGRSPALRGWRRRKCRRRKQSASCCAAPSAAARPRPAGSRRGRRSSEASAAAAARTACRRAGSWTRPRIARSRQGQSAPIGVSALEKLQCDSELQPADPGCNRKGGDV